MKKYKMAPNSYNKWLNYHDGLLYLSMLTIDGYSDWRFLTMDEINEIETIMNMWSSEAPAMVTAEYLANEKRWVVPVRDVND